MSPRRSPSAVPRLEGGGAEQRLDLPTGENEPVVVTVAPDAVSLVITADANARGIVLVDLAGTRSGDHAVSIRLAAGARVHCVHLQRLEAAADVSLPLAATLHDAAHLTWHLLSFGAGKLTQRLRNELLGPDAVSTVDWVCAASAGQRLSLGVVNAFRAPRGGGEITLRLAAAAGAVVRAEGLIDIGLQGGGTATYLTQDVLMLDPAAQVDVVPGLEIKTNDVRASHSAGVTRLTDDDLFAFAARGIPPVPARAMLIEGFLATLLQRLPPDMRPVCAQALADRLMALGAGST